MQLKTILNRVTNYKSFVFGKIILRADLPVPTLDVELKPRANGRPICSGCDKPAPGYDTMPTPRRFDFVPLWGIATVFVYSMRRVNCRQCGVKVERVPWADGKSTMTNEYKWYLAKWARRMSWKEVSEALHVSWDRVFETVKHAVSWGLARRDLDNVESIGVDEVQWHRGQNYQTVVYQLDEGNKRLLWIGAERTAKTLLRFFRFWGKERTERLEFICSDMWQGYLKVIRKKASHAVHVLDRFHVMKRINKAINKVRVDEVRQLKLDGYEPHLKGGRWAAETAGESDRKANRQTAGASSLQPQKRPRLSHARRLSAILGLSESSLGRQVSGPVVHTCDAEQDRSNEGCGAQPA
jgi:transposase